MTPAQRRVLKRFLGRARLGVYVVTPEYASMQTTVIRPLIEQGYLRPVDATSLRLTAKGRIEAERIEAHGVGL